MPQIHVLGMVPIVGGHIRDRMALIIGRIVDQDGDWAKLRARFRDRSLQHRNVSHVAAKKERRAARALHRRRHRFTLLTLDVDEGDAPAIAGKRARCRRRCLSRRR